MANEKRLVGKWNFGINSQLEYWKEPQYTETEVRFNDEVICCIISEDRDKFSNELTELIEKYRI